MIFQVRRKVPGKLSARSVRIPSAIVDVVVVDPDQRQSYEIVYDPSISGEQRDDQLSLEAPDFSSGWPLPEEQKPNSVRRRDQLRIRHPGSDCIDAGGRRN